MPWRKLWRPALGALAVLLLAWNIGQGFQIRQQQQQITQFQARAAQNRAIAVAAFGNEDAQDHQLGPTEVAPEASGRVLLSPSAPAVALYARNLPALPPGNVYQIWWVQEDQTSSIGTFTVDSQGRTWNLIQPEQQLDPPQRIFITSEPEGGSVQPTGTVYLSATF